MKSADVAGAAMTWTRSHSGVRMRAALSAVLVVGVVLGLGALALVLVLQRSLTRSLDAAAMQRAQQIAATVASEGGTGLDRSLVASPEDQSVVQVVREDGAVLGSSPELVGKPALSLSRPRPGHSLSVGERTLVGGEPGKYRVAAVGVRGPDGRYVVYVAQTSAAVQESVGTVAALLAVGLPVLVFAVGGSTFVLVGLSLRPVEAIRRRVAGITEHDLAARVPLPPAQDEIARLAVTMNQMLTRLQGAQLAQRRFIADASHELRSPLATVKGNAELVHGVLTGNGMADAAELMLSETARLERLIADLLTLAKLEERGATSGAYDVDLDDVVELERRRLRSGTTLLIGGHCDATRVRGDGHQVAQVVRNLADNAVRHARGRVNLSVGVEGATAYVEVADDGLGVPPAERQRIFDRFVRLDESRERSRGGSGLGLSIVREVMQAHGGSVTVTETPGGGATFRVSFPWVATDRASMSPAATRQPPAATSR